MTIQQLKCAVEVWKCGSINKAAERLYMNQPNISRLIKNLESEFNLTLFSRTSSGMVATKDGELFLAQAERLVKNTDTFEYSFKHNSDNATTFRIALPRGSYLTKAFSRTLNVMSEDHPLQVTFNETNNEEVIHCVSDLNYDVGIIRLPIEYESKYKKLLAEKQLKFQEVMVFRFLVAMHKSHPLANREMVHFSDLLDYTALVHGDNQFHAGSNKDTDQLYRSNLYKNSISIFERGSQFDFLRDVPGTFMLISPLPKELLNAYDLVQVRLPDDEMGLIEDLMITRRDHRYTDFVQELMHQILEVEREIML